MKKIAIFVEGQTEQLFMQELIRRFLGNLGAVSTVRFFGGKKTQRRIIMLHSGKIKQNCEYFFMIYDCANDARVKTDIIEQLPSLAKAQFSHVIGIRDVYPHNNEIDKLRKYLYMGIPELKIPVKIILAVNEVEAWFLAEEFHFSKVSRHLNISLASRISGINLKTDSTESIEHPAEVLNAIYKKANIAYRKKKRQIQRTIKKLDYRNLLFNVRKRNPSFSELIESLENCLIETED